MGSSKSCSSGLGVALSAKRKRRADWVGVSMSLISLMKRSNKEPDC